MSLNAATSTMHWAQERSHLILDAFGDDKWAGVGSRLAAQLLDFMFFYAPILVVCMTVNRVIGGDENGALLDLITLVGFPALVAAYQTAFTGDANRPTPGREILRIAVVDASSGQGLGFGRAYWRCLLSLLGSLLIIPNLIAAFTARKRSVADFLAHTVVVRYEPRPPSGVKWLNVLLIAAGFAMTLAIMSPIFQELQWGERVAMVSGDLANYARRLEIRQRETGGAITDLDSLGYSPRSRSARYSLSKTGVLYAAFPAPHGQTSYLSLYSEYDADTKTYVWHCRSLGIEELLLPPGCPESETADPSSEGAR